jgi:branched-chain amino acid transport system permease protein
MQGLIQQIINGLSIGAIYALIAVGYTMVYGVLRLINFAHGDVYMVGAMVATLAATRWFPASLAGSPSWLGLAIVLLTAMIICGLLGLLIERFAYRPLRNQPRMTCLITAIGVSMLLEYGGQHPAIFGPDPRPFPQLLPGDPVLLRLGQVSIDRADALIFVTTLALMLILQWIIQRTRMGMALRAVSFRTDTAALMGINVNRVISFTFVLGSVLAAAAGVLVGLRNPRVDPMMGLVPGIKAFVAAVLGGIGNVSGAVLGALLLGLIEVLVVGYVPSGSQYRDGIAFVILVLVLLLRPSGLLGRNLVEKV